ncbi:MAG: DUF302 domain-containing protein [Bryobacteraceae bacterium]|jgi:uncharacterized protein (DUF302 family)
MLQVPSEHPLVAIEAALRSAAQREGSSVLSVTHVGQHLRESASAEDAFVFSICAGELYAALLAADIRISAFLPCRIAAYSERGQTILATAPPLDFCRPLNRADLAPLLTPLEGLLRRIMEDAAAPRETSAPAVAAAHTGGLGATEDQMNVRGSIPQRIDCKGTKVEDLGGTGGHDSQGG